MLRLVFRSTGSEKKKKKAKTANSLPGWMFNLLIQEDPEGKVFKGWGCVLFGSRRGSIFMVLEGNPMAKG